MENVSAIRKCQLCGKLLKKQDIGDACKKCSAQTKPEVESTLIETSDIAPTNFEVVETEPEINTDVEVIPSEILPENITKPTTHEQPELTPEPIPETNIEEPKVEVSTLKPGQAIRDKFMKLVAEGKIIDDYVFELCSKEGTAKFFGVRYPFLKEFNPEFSIKELTYINGRARYSSKPVTIGDRQYLITNDLYKATVPKFMAWSESL